MNARMTIEELIRGGRAVGIAALVLVLGGQPSWAAAACGTTERVNLSASGAEAQGGHSGGTAISGDGRYVAFGSNAANLVPGDTNGVKDIFVRDRQTGTTERVSVSSAGAQSNASSDQPKMSADGRYVAFASTASNLVFGDTNGKQDIFVHDRLAHSTTRVSLNSDGTQRIAFGSPGFPIWQSFTEPAIDGSGRLVAFTGSPTSARDFPHVLLHDQLTDTTTIAGLVESGLPIRSGMAALSGDGRYLAYKIGCCSATFDLIIRDLVGGTVTRASHNVFGSDLRDPVLSGDGRYAAFSAKLGGTQVWVYDRIARTTELVGPVGFVLGQPAISADGRYVGFFSLVSTLVPGDTNGVGDVFVRDRQTGLLERVSVSSDGAQANGASHDPAMSTDGRTVAFDSGATNLVPGDTNALQDIFVRQGSSCAAAPIAAAATISPSANGAGWNQTDVTVAIAASGGLAPLQVTYTLAGAQNGTTTVAGDTATVTISVEGTTNLTYFAQDSSGARSTEHSLVVNLDKTPPAVTTARTPAANASGWNNSDVTVSFQATDALSGIDGAASADVTFTLEAGGQSASRTFTDLAGNTASATASDINIDKTPPAITVTRSPAPNANGWNNTDVTVSFQATDALSGVDGAVSADVVLTAEGAGQSASRTFTDRAGNTAIATLSGINIDRTPPVVSAVSVDPNPVGVDPTTGQATTTLSATITDALSGVASAEYRVGATAAWLPLGGSSGTYTVALALPVGVYDLYVRGSDAAGNTSAEASTLVAVYDPEGGFVTGGGWITSPKGAYTFDPTATGRATFGFVSKYLPGRQTPSGQTEFQFRAVGFNFHSTDYEWLVVSGARAQYKGTGTINGAGSYGFLLTAIDGQISGGGGSDRFRIKIWSSGGVIYDNQLGAADSDDPTTAVNGSIVVHK